MSGQSKHNIGTEVSKFDFDCRNLISTATRIDSEASIRIHAESRTSQPGRESSGNVARWLPV